MLRVHKRPNEAGFTLVEVMAVLGIMMLLMGMVLFGARRYRRVAYEKGTQAIVEKLRSALETYQSKYRKLPPDGHDFEVFRMVNGSRQQIKGTACLIHFLGQPTVQIYEVGEEQRKKTVPPILELNTDMLSGSGELEERLNDPTVQIIDRWGNLMQYDNVTKARDGTIRFTPLPGDGEGGDPRTTEGGSGPKNSGAYDIWSQGAELDDPTDDITNW
ncbi:MAG: prepilin-type N-terminal cleavage/methylation domain-containing protein [Planctomycetota bacterium]|jgi:competence protein ComGC